jgi:hypothetical protein
MLQLNPALLEQFIATMGYNPLIAAAPAPAAPPAATLFVPAGPLAGVSPLAVKQPPKPAEPPKVCHSRLRVCSHLRAADRTAHAVWCAVWCVVCVQPDNFAFLNPLKS